VRGHDLEDASLADQHTVTGTFRSAVVHDRLALDLTTLANERTFLAYIRTALAFIAAGAALLSDVIGAGRTISTVAWVFIGLGVAITIVGVVRYLQVRHALRTQWLTGRPGSDST
jgi:putative membrane protein